MSTVLENSGGPGSSITLDPEIISMRNNYLKALEGKAFDDMNSLIQNKLSSHIFRHSFATTMLENNADIRHIQKLLGHSSISTTEIYTKVAKSMKKRVLDSYHPLKNKL